MSETMRIRAIRVTTLPQDLAPGPGGTNLRMAPGDELDLDAARARANARYLNGRIRAGDLVDVTAKGDSAAPAPQPAASSPATAKGAEPPKFGGVS